MPDELLSSWLVRIANVYQIKLHTLCHAIWPYKQIWTRNIDNSVDDEIINTLSDYTATPYNRIYNMTLKSFQGNIFEKHIQNGNTKWVLPLGRYHRINKMPGQQFCQLCLKEDIIPYYRRSWRLGFITSCSKHKTILQNTCSQCGSPINFHRIPTESDSLIVCSECKSKFIESTYVSSKASSKLSQFQRIIQTTMENGWIDIPGTGPVYSHLFFDVLHQILKILSTGKIANTIRSIVCSEANLPFFEVDFDSKLRMIERLDTLTRANLLTLAAWLVADWPDRFVWIFKNNKVYQSPLLKDFNNAPFWYWYVVHYKLNGATYSPTDLEIIAAKQFLRSSGRPFTKTELAKVLGASDPFRKHPNRTV